eukprot:8614835-Ditylum_brightwellii.AAC.1
MSVSNVATVAATGTTDIVVATSVTTESDVTKVGETGVVVAMNKMVVTMSITTVSNVAKMVAKDAT